MTLEEFKTFILNNGAPTELVILKFADDTGEFLASQYIDTICDKDGLAKKYIKSLCEAADKTYELVNVLDKTLTLNILHIDTLSEIPDNLYALDHTIAVCKNIDKKIAEELKPYIIEIPAIYKAKDTSKMSRSYADQELAKDTSWQVKAYMRLLCPELSETDIEKLYDATDGSMYKLKNELDKINLFESADKKKILDSLLYSNESDLFNMTVFQFIDAILNRDLNFIASFLRHRQFCTAHIEGMGLAVHLTSKLKNMLYASPDSRVSSADFDPFHGQGYFASQDLKTVAGRYLDKLIPFITEIDYKIKNGEMDIDADSLADYVLCHVLGLMY